MMMSADAESACGGEHPYVVAAGNMVPLPPAPSLFLPVMDQLESSSLLMRSEQLSSSHNMEANVPALLAPASNGAANDYNSHDIQFYPSASHYLAVGNPNSYLSRSTFLPTPLECYFPTLLDGNMASFGTTQYAQLGINSLNYGGYSSYYLPPRAGYAYRHHALRCQVDGCTADLSKAKRYHRRHRVCEHHSKAPVVITARAIMPQRFCQQCSRFHEVDEFDDGKKSCRQRLADHNRRRRKPKPSGVDVPSKMTTHAKRSATAKDKGSSSKNRITGHVLGAQELGSAPKEQDRSMGLGEVVRELGDPKGKAPMTKHQARISQTNLEQVFPLLSSPVNGTYCLPQSQPVSGGVNTSNKAPVQEPGLAFHQHYQQGNILQLGQAVFDLDFDH